MFDKVLAQIDLPRDIPGSIEGKLCRNSYPLPFSEERHDRLRYDPTFRIRHCGT